MSLVLFRISQSFRHLPNNSQKFLLMIAKRQNSQTGGQKGFPGASLAGVRHFTLWPACLPFCHSCAGLGAAQVQTPPDGEQGVSNRRFCPEQYLDGNRAVSDLLSGAGGSYRRGRCGAGRRLMAAGDGQPDRSAEAAAQAARPRPARFETIAGTVCGNSAPFRHPHALPAFAGRLGETPP